MRELFLHARSLHTHGWLGRARESSSHSCEVSRIADNRFSPQLMGLSRTAQNLRMQVKRQICTGCMTQYAQSTQHKQKRSPCSRARRYQFQKRNKTDLSFSIELSPIIPRTTSALRQVLAVDYLNISQPIRAQATIRHPVRCAGQ